MKRCNCPTGLGYRFHRHPCPLAGQIDNLAAETDTPAALPADHATNKEPNR